MATENDELRKLIQAALDKRSQEKPKGTPQTPSKSGQSSGGSPQQNRPVQRQEGRPATGQKQTTRGSSNSTYRFLNPYNFVRFLRAPNVFPDDPETQLISRCAPPPHDRYTGLSGEIICELENVTPLFIADPEILAATDDGHQTYHFFHYDFGDGQQPALPAASVRGMVRNIFEAATNSCFSIFDYDARYSYHLDAREALKLIPGRIEKDEAGRWHLRLLPGTAHITVGDRPHDKLYAGRVERYKALRPTFRKKSKDNKPPVFKPVSIYRLNHGDPCFALATNRQFPPVWEVKQVAQTREGLPAPDKDEQIFAGYLSINNQNIENKRFERFFFRDPTNKSGAEFVLLAEDVLRKYTELMHDYQDRHRATIDKWNQKGWKPNQTQTYTKSDGKEVKEAAFSRFIYSDKFELAEGELVYAMLSGPARAPSVEFIVPVAIPRIGFERKVSQLLPRHLWKCEDHDELCPACRLFGWVYGHEEGDLEQLNNRAKVVAYAGRVRFEHGRLISPAPVMPQETTLAILSSPKPTTTRFYLKPSFGEPRNGLDDYQAGYDNRNNMLRGRKVFRHHGHNNDQEHWEANEREYHRRDRDGKPIRDDQNRTLQGVLQPGARFRFTISFSNLAEVELGALLWSLELEGNQYHRLGLGKPLGFGSVQLRIQEMNLYDIATRYTDLYANSVQSIPANQRQIWCNRFKETMQRAYEQSFTELPHIKELLLLLSDPQLDLPIHYPRTEVEPDPEGKNYEWFMGNNRNRDARLALEMPDKEKGLPLIDRAGYLK